MKHTLRNAVYSLCLLIGLGPSLALAQSAPATLPYHTVYGRIGATVGDTGPGQAIPFGTLQGILANGSAIFPDLVGGGVDNSAALATALAQCTTGGNIIIPIGTYSYGTGLSLVTSGCNIIGSGRNSVLNYTGSGTGLSISGGVDNITIRDLKIASPSITNTLVQISNTANGLNFDRVFFNQGGAQVQITSSGSGVGGSYSVRFTHSEFNASGIAGLLISPADFGLAQAIYVDNCDFFGYVKQAIYQTSGSGIFISHSRFERHLGATITQSSIHVDLNTKFVLRDSYLEDEANAPQIDVGAGVANLQVVGNYLALNVAGGTHTNAGALKLSSTAPDSIEITNNHVSISGTIGSVWDTGATVKVVGLANGFDSGTAVWGFASSAASTSIIIEGTTNNATNPTTFSSGVQQVGVTRMAVDLSNYASGTTGTGPIVRQTSPALITPTLGDAAAASLSTPGSSGAGVALGGTTVPTGNTHGVLNFDTGGAIYVNGVATANIVTAGMGLLGVPTAPTASLGTNTTQISTMAALLAQANTRAALAGNNTFVNSSATPGQRLQFDSADATPTAINNQTLTLSNFNTTNNNYNTIMFTSKDTGGTERAGSGLIGVFQNRSASMVKSDLALFTRSLAGTVNFPLYISDSSIIFGSSASASFPAIIPSSTTAAFRLGDGSADAPITAAAGTFSGALKSSTTIASGTLAVGSLPACNSGLKGARYFVTDANATTFHSTVAAGGANNVGVTCDGTNWYISANDNVPTALIRKFA